MASAPRSNATDHERSPIRRWMGWAFAVLGVLALVPLGGQFQNDRETLLQLLPAAEVERLQACMEGFGEGGPAVLVVAPAEVGARIAQLPQVLHVGEPLPTTEKGRTSIVPVQFRGSELGLEAAKEIDAELTSLLGEFGEEAFYMGTPRWRVASWEYARADLLRLLPVLALLAFGIPWLLLGSSGAGLYALIVAALTVGITMWGYRLVHGPLSTLSVVLVPVLWAIATMDAMHFAGRLRPRHGDVRAARRDLLGPCAWTTLTTASGLLVMGAIAEGLLSEFGYVAAFGVLTAFAVTFWASPVALVVGTLGEETRGARTARRVAVGLQRSARRRPRLCIALWLALLALSAVAARGLRVSMEYPHVFAEGTELERDLTRLASLVDTDLRPLEVILEDDEAPTDLEAKIHAALGVRHHLHTLPEVRFVLPFDGMPQEDGEGESWADTWAHAYPAEREALLERWAADESFRPWIDIEGGRLHLQAHFAPMTFERNREVLGWLEHFDRTMLSRHRLSLAGQGYIATRVEELGLDDLRRSVGWSVLALAVGLVVALRSSWRGALALFVSFVPLVVAAGLMGYVGATWSIALMALPVCLLGIAVDDSIHLLWRGQAPRGASLPAILATTAIVGASVAMLGTTSFTMNRTFGWVMATGLVLALLADLTLLPAVLRGSRRRALR